MDVARYQVIDWASFQRLDNAALVDFLASAASVLNARGLISHKEIDNLRVILSSIHSSTDDRSRPLLLELERLHGDFLTILFSRFGVTGLSLNILRHTLADRLWETRRHLAELGQILIKRAELLFNRPFRIYSAGKQQKTTLFSSVLVEWCEKIASCDSQLDQICKELSFMTGHEMAGSNDADRDIDGEIAKALGFQGVVYPVLTGQAEAEILREISKIMDNVGQTATLFLRQLTFNVGSDAVYAALAVTERLSGEARLFEHQDLIGSANLFTMEMRRRHLLLTFAGIDDIFSQLKSLLSQCLSSSEGTTSHAQSVDHPEATRRRLAFEMISNGIAPHHASDASKALLTYLSDHNIQAKDVLVGELARIHTALTPRALELLVGLTSDQGGNLDPHPEKEMTLSKVLRLQELFANILVSGVLSGLLCMVLLTSCGLKTSPRSEIVEFRPDIPFRDQNGAYEKEPVTPPQTPRTLPSPIRRP
jgi:hypothetical protein